MVANQASLDERLAEANELLSDSASYDRAIAQYRAILVSHPAFVEARMWLARVLAWQGAYEESLREYDYFTNGADPPPWSYIERAEVLSWAGRLPAAETAFSALLERNPNDARATLGLARVYLWSGRFSRAEATFERGLALGEDEAARRELLALRARLARRAFSLEADSDFATDNEGFSLLQSRARATVDLDYRTRVLVAAGSTWIDLHRGGAAPRRLDDVSAETWIGLERRFDDSVTAGIRVGLRRWSEAPDHFLGSATLQVSTPNGASLTLGVEHGDFLERSNSIDAVRSGISDTTLRFAVWQPLLPRLDVYAWTESSFLDDSNERIAAGFSLDVTPWREREVVVSLVAGYVGYTGRSDLYFDPKIDTSGSLALRVQHSLFEKLDFELRSEVGLGYASQDGVSGFGFTWAIAGGPRWHPGDGWWLALRGRTSRSQRSSSYSTCAGGLSVGRAF